MARSFETAAPDIYDILKTNARKNRQQMTYSETLLWDNLRRRIKSYKFRRQHPIGDYIADFICLPAKLIVEVDGGYHDRGEQQQLDEWRTDFLESIGFRVMRFKNEDVNYNIDDVLYKINEELVKFENKNGY